MKTRFNSIGIYGSSSGRNAGDAALIAGIMDAVDSRLGKRLIYEIPTYRPEYIWKNYENKVRPVPMAPWWGSAGMFGIPTLLSFLRCDLNVIYDNMLFDRALANPLFNYMPAVWLYFVKLRRPNQILGMYNCGLGPVTTERGKKMLKEIAEACHFITVRDHDSAKMLDELGIPKEKYIVTADAALTVQPPAKDWVRETYQSVGLNPDEEILGLNVNTYINTWTDKAGSSLTREEFAKIYGQAVTKVLKELNVPALFVCTQHHDVEITKEVMKHVQSSKPVALISNQSINHTEIKGVLGQLALLFAMRLHANILGSSMCTPTISLAFQKKVVSYYQELRLPENVMSFENFSVDTLSSHILKGWEKRFEIRKHLEQRIPQLQEKALLTAEVIGLIDSGVSPLDALETVRPRTV
jgi:polysaccharide pyruvyl transferase WcaK-like protein